MKFYTDRYNKEQSTFPEITKEEAMKLVADSSLKLEELNIDNGFKNAEGVYTNAYVDPESYVVIFFCTHDIESWN